MPELPEVETVRRGLERVTPGHCLEGGEVLLARAIAHPAHEHEFLAGLTGATLSAWHRRGKYLLGQLSQSDGSPGGYLGVHLRMTGQLLWLDPTTPVQPHCRVRLWLSDHHELRYVDQRTFGRLWWIPPGITPDTIMTGLNRLGPEPFDDSFSVAYLGQRLRRSRRPIKNALLDQALVAGIGNIYADEALFLSGIRPLTPCDRIGTQRIQ
ncbi:MAG: DNA-formamidopyrimidine glycosylase, partial [Cyanobacteria bacterium J06638_6]